jgi:hypothetical protein
MKFFGLIATIIVTLAFIILGFLKIPLALTVISIIASLVFCIYFTIILFFHRKFKGKISEDAPIAKKGFIRWTLFLLASVLLNFLSIYLFSIGSFENDIYTMAFIFAGFSGLGSIYWNYMLVLPIYESLKILLTSDKELQ